MMIRNWILTPVVLCILTACGAEEEPPRRDAMPTGSPGASATGTTMEARTDDAGERTSPELDGQIEFSFGETNKSFDFIAPEHTFYNRLASKIHAQTSRDSREAATIVFSNVDLEKLDYPIELPLPRDAVDPANPMMSAIMIGFGYIDEQGNEWAGPGRVRLESFGADGTITGSFTDVSLLHTEKDLPNIVLQDGRFTASLWSR